MVKLSSVSVSFLFLFSMGHIFCMSSNFLLTAGYCEYIMLPNILLCYHPLKSLFHSLSGQLVKLHVHPHDPLGST